MGPNFFFLKGRGVSRNFSLKNLEKKKDIEKKLAIFFHTQIQAERRNEIHKKRL